MTKGNDTLYFIYDAEGTPVSVKYNGVLYNYVTNLQGDVTAILTWSGQKVVSYTYDAWGKQLSCTGSMSSTLGKLNPLRYRGYVYDQETRLYYLQSRYYNPEWGRFINADVFVSTGQGFIGNNMFAYCNNNPVIYKDAAGLMTVTAIVGAGAVVGAGAATSLLPIVVVAVLIIGVASHPQVQDVISKGYERANTGVSDWLDELQNTITNKMAISLEKSKNKEQKRYHVHHIVAQSDPRAAHSRYIVELLFEHGVNNVINLILVSENVHRRLHTNAYFTFVEATILDAFYSARPNIEDQRNGVTSALLWLRGFIGALSLV